VVKADPRRQREVKKLNTKNKAASTPTWVRDAVFYQIFPDRFANGDESNDTNRTQSWGEPPNRQERQGGDLAGLRKRFDYLSDLGINALYLNPIFEAASNHGYDTSDYYRISFRLGTNEQFANLVEEAHERDWHVVLDGVFNHTGTQFHAFQNLRKEGEGSPYIDWYHVEGFPINMEPGKLNYKAWNGQPEVPQLNHANPAVRAYLLDVAVHWIREYGIDGWRLDMPEEIPHDFWKEFRKRVREANPNAYLVGELWNDASDWLQGDEFDAAMNYRWRGAVCAFLAEDKMSPTEFDAALRQIRDDYPPEATAAMLNMLSSHDVDRLATRCGGNRLRMGQCVLMQMTYPGVPCVYYGDEIALHGDGDPGSRAAMPWDEDGWDTGFRDFYKRLIALRQKHPVLRYGDYRTVLLNDDKRLFGFTRCYDGENSLALFNNSAEAQCAEVSPDVVEGRKLFDWLRIGIELEEEDDRFLVALSPRGIALLGSSQAT
jgi:cyclomaltodextrinase / maltogenic alpha-amylase / neopullulanase